MYEPTHYSSDSQDEENDDEEEDITDYEGYHYDYYNEEEVEGEEEYEDEESDQTRYSDSDYYEERDYSDGEPEIVCSTVTTVTSRREPQLSGRRSQEVWCRVRRKVWDLMVIIIAFCVAVMLGFYSMS